MLPNEPISLDPELNNTASDLASLPPPESPTYKLTPEQLDKRANKINVALEGTPAQLPYDQIKQFLYQDDEKGLREQSSAILNAEAQQHRADAIMEGIRKKGAMLNEEDMTFLFGSAPPKFFNPDYIVEHTYTQKYFDELDKFTSTDPDNEWNVAAREVPFLKQAVVDVAHSLMTKRQIILSALQDLNAQQDDPAYKYSISNVVDWLTINALPFRYNIGIRGNIGDTGMLEGFTTAANLEIQRNKLWDMPVPEFAQTVRTKAKEMAAVNPQLATIFLTQMLGQSTSDKVLNTLNDAFDVGSITGAARLAAKPVKLVNSFLTFREYAKDLIKGSSSPEETKATILATIGNPMAGAVENATARVTANITGVNTTATSNMLDAIPRYYRIDKAELAANPSKFLENAENIIVEDYNRGEARNLNAIFNSMRLNNLPIENATREQLDILKQTVVDRYPGIRNNVTHIDDPVVNAHGGLDVTFGVGPKPGEFFSSPTMAKNYAKAQNISDAVPVLRQGGGYYLQITRPLNFWETTVGDFMAGIDEFERATAKAPESFMDILPFGAGSYARTAEDTMSLEHLANRKAATYPMAVMYALMKEEEKFLKTTPGFGALKRKEWKQLQHTLEENRKMYNPDTDKLGLYFKNIPQLEEYYTRIFNRRPSLPEARAYFAVKRLSETDRILREVSLHHNMSTHGAETIHLIVNDATGKELRSDPIAAIPRDKLPGGKKVLLRVKDRLDNTTLEELDDEVDNAVNATVGEVEPLERRTTSARKKLNIDLANGRGKLYELYDAEQRPFNGFFPDGDKRIELIYVENNKNLESSALTWDLVPRLGGGHFDYDYSKYVKQAIIRREDIGGTQRIWYEGDRTVMPVGYQAIADEFVPHMNAVRALLKENKIDDARAYARKHLPGRMATDFVDDFFPKKDLKTGKINLAKYNMEEDFHVVPKATSIVQLNNELRNRYGNNFIDGTRRGIARNFQVEYTGQRDAHDMFTIENMGTKAHPDYQINDAKLVDPITTMNRALNRIVRSSILDQYKNYAVQTWLREAQPWLKEDEAVVRSSPFYNFMTADKSSFVKNIPRENLNRLMANRFKIQQLIGVPSDMDNFAFNLADRLREATYKYAGPSVARKAEQLTPLWAMSALRDPSAFLRSITFNAYLGLFSIPQMFVQSMSYINIYGQAGRYATAGTTGATLHMLSRINKNPEIIKALDNIATKMSFPGLPKFRPGEWTEAMQAMERTGFGIVGGEFGPLDTLGTNKIIQGNFGRFLDAGQYFFKVGERNVRYGAWYTAFKEFRDIHPTGKLTNADLVKITQRADQLYGNMSSASNSILHSGFLSLPTQFYAYSIRLAELFLGKRLGATLKERNLARARILSMNAAMFGVPMAGGAAGLPFADWMRRSMMENGFFGMTDPYVRDKDGKTVGDWVQTFAMEGLPSIMLHSIMGKYYNFGPRMGSGGLSAFNEALGSDASFWKLAGGASYTLGTNFFGRDLAGFTKMMTDIFRTDAQSLRVTPEVFTDILKDTYIGGKGYITWQALNTGKWINNNSDTIDSVTWKDAIFRFATGLTNQEQTDIWHKHVAENERMQAPTDIEKKVLQEMNRGFLAQSVNNPQQAEKYFHNAMAWIASGDLNQDQISSILAKVSKANWDLISRSDWSYYIRTAPASMQEQLVKSYEQKKKQ